MSNRRDYNNTKIDPRSNSGAGIVILIFFVIFAFFAFAGRYGVSIWTSFGLFWIFFFIIICPAWFVTGNRRYYTQRYSYIPASSVKLESKTVQTHTRELAPKIITQQFCSNCESSYDANDLFCSNCGARFEKEQY